MIAGNILKPISLALFINHAVPDCSDISQATIRYKELLHQIARELLQFVSNGNGQPGRVCHPIAAIGSAFYFAIVDKEVEAVQIIDSATDCIEIGTKNIISYFR